MKSKAGTIDKRNFFQRGQVIAEYVIVLAVTLGLLLALVILMRAVGENSELAVERISRAAP